MELEKLEYRILKEPNEDVRSLLSKTVYGTKGGMRVRHCDTDWKLDELISPEFHVLYDDNMLVGVVVYTNRRSLVGGEEMNTYYIRYFRVSPNYQNHGVAQYLTRIAVKHYRENLLEPTVVYAFIEAKNFRSQAVSDHFEPLSLGYFSPIYFSRFLPKKIKDVSNSQEDFKKYYSLFESINFRYTGRSKKNARHYSIERNGSYAAVRCYAVKWAVIDYPNNNWLMKSFLPKVPLINKLVEGEELNFVSVDAIAWKSDELLIELLEHVLADYNLSKLFMFADLKDERYAMLRANKKLGVLSRLQKAPKIGIQLFFHLVSEGQKNKILDLPVEIRGFDVT